MLFDRRNDWWLAARITGPSHHFLGLRFVGSAGSERLGVAPDAAQAAAIEAGVARANQSLGTAYAVADSEVDPRDVFRAGVYEALAYALVERVAHSGTVSPFSPDPFSGSRKDAKALRGG